MYSVSDFDYNLPTELIAQRPVRPRDHSRLLVLDKKTGAISHKYFYDLIKNEYPNATFYYNQSGNEHGHNHIGRIHISTLKSAKGLEFDTVILPNFNKAFEDIERFNITWKDFYVGVTRAKSNLFLISNYDIDKLKDVVTIQVPEN